MKKYLKSYAIVALGSVIFALAFDWFFAPNQVAMGGITGLAQVINALVPWLSVGVLAFVLNVPLFLAGWKYIGFHLLASSLFSMLVSSVAIDAIAAMYAFPAMDPMLATLCGGALMGLGLGIVFSQGATTGGTDVVARLLKLRIPWLPMGKLMLVPDFVVLALAAVEILSLLRSLAQQASISDALLTPMLKVLGIEVVTNLAAHICKDAGEGGIASTVELAGAICALYTSIPVIQAVLILIEELL